MCIVLMMVFRFQFFYPDWILELFRMINSIPVEVSSFLQFNFVFWVIFLIDDVNCKICFKMQHIIFRSFYAVTWVKFNLLVAYVCRINDGFSISVF